MKFMTERVAREGRALNEDVLLVDCFLNHQVDMDLMRQCGEAFAERFRDKGITRVLTVESSGIAPAGMAALALGVPLVFMKKKTSRLTTGDVYQTPVQSFTKGTRYELTVAKRYLPAGEKVLFIDDFLAMGEAALGVARLVEEAGSEVAGINTWVAVDNLTVVGAKAKTETYRVHTVVKGDTLWGISQKYLGSGNRYPEIMKLNGLTSTLIFSGQKLNIPN